SVPNHGATGGVVAGAISHRHDDLSVRRGAEVAGIEAGTRPFSLEPSRQTKRSRQGKGNERVAEFGPELAVAARGDHHELLAVRAQAVGHRRRLAAGRQPALPQFGAGVDVEGARRYDDVAPWRAAEVASRTRRTTWRKSSARG